MVDDPLAGLPRLPTEAMAPCVVCRRQLLETELPLFFRLDMKRCGIDPAAVRERVGIALTWDGARPADAIALADIFASRKPVVVMDSFATFNVCWGCTRSATLETIAAHVIAASEEAREQKYQMDKFATVKGLGEVYRGEPEGDE